MSFSAWKLSPSSASIQTIHGAGVANGSFLKQHFAPESKIRTFPIVMKDGTTYTILHDDQTITTEPANNAAKVVFKRLNLAWYNDSHSWLTNGPMMREGPKGTFLIFCTKPGADQLENTMFPTYANVKEWVVHVNQNIDYSMHFRHPCSHALTFPSVPKVTKYLQNLAESADTSLNILAPLAVSALLKDGAECPIRLEPLSSYSTVYVPECGHVCGPDAISLKKCPVCRVTCTWTSVPVA
jgi:hypothetical protein